MTHLARASPQISTVIVIHYGAVSENALFLRKKCNKSVQTVNTTAIVKHYDFQCHSIFTTKDFVDF